MIQEQQTLAADLNQLIKGVEMLRKIPNSTKSMSVLAHSKILSDQIRAWEIINPIVNKYPVPTSTDVLDEAGVLVRPTVYIPGLDDKGNCE
jgi:hypothetical protein